ncbi:hypothetical protein LTR64_002383 [Lithohypha guttulata]|uniref:uncharacterized protein n=1 Tax=Lithohypha guttulata TaxID=1690604 RepID=UPI002DE00474|nr:hypothetical protein LTR51_001391 [Lithohypha guttulata]
MTVPTPKSTRFIAWTEDDVPTIDINEDFNAVVQKLSHYIIKAIDAAYNYEQLRTTIAGHSLRPLVFQLGEECRYPAIIAALLAARYSFGNISEDPRLAESRALACELVAFDLVLTLSEKELIDQLLYELPVTSEDDEIVGLGIGVTTPNNHTNNESSPLLENQRHKIHPSPLRPPQRPSRVSTLSSNSILTPKIGADQDDLADEMAGLNALEIAAVANCKKFMSQKPVQAVVEDIWNGNIIFWDSLSTNAKKSAKIYNKRTADPFSRLRVPKYQKAFQVAFFIAFLVLYYAVLVQRNPRSVTVTEVLLYVWIAAFAYDEIVELRDAGFLFYQTDFWSIWDLAIILVGLAFFITRVIGLVKDSSYITDVAFDILSMAALFLVPRICSVASLNPYFGSLLPVLKEMTTAFCKFLPVILILYLGFLTTFTMLARDRLTLNEVSWLLIKVFFGSSYLGFDVAVQISPIFGYTLM